MAKSLPNIDIMRTLHLLTFEHYKAIINDAETKEDSCMKTADTASYSNKMPYKLNNHKVFTCFQELRSNAFLFSQIIRVKSVIIDVNPSDSG
jgi:hypothetical protein